MSDLLAAQADEVLKEQRGSRPKRGRRFGLRGARWSVVLSIAVLLMGILWATWPGLFTSQDPFVGVPADRLRPPSGEHLFGTDQLGRDTYTRTVYAAKLSLQAIAIAVALALVIGSLVGLIAGFMGGWVDGLLMRVVDVMLAIPALLLSLAIVAVLGFGTINVAIAVGLASVASFARLMRAEVLRVRTAVYVEASYALGARWFQTLRRHVLPNSTGPVLSMAALELGSAVLAVSALSFLGYGAKPPDPEWGSLISSGRDYMGTAWWLTTLPGLVVMALVLAANRLARTIGAGAER